MVFAVYYSDRSTVIPTGGLHEEISFCTSRIKSVHTSRTHLFWASMYICVTSLRIKVGRSGLPFPTPGHSLLWARAVSPACPVLATTIIALNNSPSPSHICFCGDRVDSSSSDRHHSSTLFDLMQMNHQHSPSTSEVRSLAKLTGTIGSSVIPTR